NYIYYDNGKVAEKVVKNASGEEISSFEYNEQGKIVSKSFFRAGHKALVAFISFNENGHPDLSHDNSHFLRLWKSNNWLYIKPIGTEYKVFKDAYINFVDNFQNNDNPMEKGIMFDTDSILKIDLHKLENITSLKSEIYIRESDY